MRDEKDHKLLFDLDSIDKLAPEKKYDYVQLAINNCLKNHPDGITVQLMSELTGLNQRTVKIHLEHLTATREVVKKEYGTRMAIYFSNGKLSPDQPSKSIVMRNSMIHMQLIENTWGKFVYIQERKNEPSSKMLRTVGGVMIDLEHVQDLVESLQEIAGLDEIDGER